MDITADEQRKAFEICSEHLNGAWRKVSLKDVVITRQSGGMTNLLYRCALGKSIETQDNEPREVLLRIYGHLPRCISLQLEVFNQLASVNLGPKLHGKFDGGRLEEYLPSIPLTRELMIDDAISAVVAQKIASIQKLEFESLRSVPDFVINKCWGYNEIVKQARGLPVKLREDSRESTRQVATEMINIDFKKEIESLASLLNSRNASPLVFSHNDLHQNNIILLHENPKSDKPHKIDLNDRIVFIDFEYCSYNYRTFDLANHLNERCFDYNGTEYPFFKSCKEWFPSDEKQKEFIKHYLRHIDDTKFFHPKSTAEISDDDKVDLLFDEMQPSLMASNLLWAIWAVQSALTSKIDFGYWEMAKSKWEFYCLCRDRVLQRA